MTAWTLTVPAATPVPSTNRTALWRVSQASAGEAPSLSRVKAVGSHSTATMVEPGLAPVTTTDTGRLETRPVDGVTVRLGLVAAAAAVGWEAKTTVAEPKAMRRATAAVAPDRYLPHPRPGGRTCWSLVDMCSPSCEVSRVRDPAG